jgi:hypothetical protein
MRPVNRGMSIIMAHISAVFYISFAAPSNPYKRSVTSARIRPRFREIHPLDPEEVIGRLSRMLRHPESPCTGRVVPGHAVINIPEEEIHFWSPQLSISVEEHEEGGSLVRGLYGPRPAVWTLIMFIYAAIAFLGLMGLFLGYSQWALDKPADALWIVPVSLVLGATVYVGAQIGQKLGNEQMETLHEFLESALREA